MGPGIACVFAKPPGPGAKTRLAQGVGPAVAERLARAMLQDTVHGLQRWGRARVILATPAPGVDHGVPLPGWDQGGGDLGQRLERVLRRALASAPWALAVGGDGPGLPAGHLERVREAVGRGHVALGPAEDGGFWGIGLTRCPPGLFEGLVWSAPSTGEAVRRRIEGLGWTVEPAPGWFDVDEVDDLVRFRERVAPEAAPRTWAVLRSLR